MNQLIVMNRLFSIKILLLSSQVLFSSFVVGGDIEPDLKGKINSIFEEYTESGQISHLKLEQLLSEYGDELRRIARESYGPKTYASYVWVPVLQVIPANDNKEKFIESLTKLSNSDVLFTFSNSAWISLALLNLEKGDFPGDLYKAVIQGNTKLSPSFLLSLGLFSEEDNAESIDLLIKVLESHDAKSPESLYAARGLLVPAYKYNNSKASSALAEYRKKFFSK